MPFGFTLLIWTSGERVSGAFPGPHLPQFYWFVGGAAVAYLFLSYTVGLMDLKSSITSRMPQLAVVEVVALMGAVGSEQILDVVSIDWVAYFVVPLFATTVYIVVMAVLQQVAVRLYGRARSES